MPFQGIRIIIIDCRLEMGMGVVMEAKNINGTFVLSFPPKKSQSSMELAPIKTGLYQK
jgi:hypothetical protein